MPTLSSRICNSVETWSLCCLVGLLGCGGQVEMIALTGAGGTWSFDHSSASSGTGGAKASNGATAGLCAQPGCVAHQDAGIAGAPLNDVFCVYDGTLYAAGMSFASTDGCNTCSCSGFGVGCTGMACNWGAGGSAGIGGALSTGGAWTVGGSQSTGAVPSIVPTCPGISISTTSIDAGTSGASDASGVCTGFGITAEPTAVDLFIMLDRTQSMTYTIQNSSLQRWDVIEQGLQKLTPSYRYRNRVGLGYVGKTGNPSDAGECDANAYAQPAVPIDYLRNNSTTVVQSVTDERALLGGQAPWFPALQGGLQFTQKWQTANPSNDTVFIFVTDGFPAECDTDVIHISALVGDARQARGLFAGGPSIYTYVVGIAVDRSNLDAVAQAGGTLRATIVDGPGALDQFAAALENAVNSIGAVHIACDFSIPPPPAGKVLDLDRVQVVVDSYNGDRQEIPRATSAEYCGSPNGGWYFDDATSPSKITLCPCTCANLSTAEGDVNFGCRSAIAIN